MVDLCLLHDTALRSKHVGLDLISQCWPELEVTNEVMSEHELAEYSSFSEGEVLDIGDHEPE